MMKTRLILAASTLGALLSSPALAQDGDVSASAAAPKMRAQAQVEILPLGSAEASIGDASTEGDTDLAYGISATFDYAVTPFLSIGVAPRLVLNVIPEDAEEGDDADKQLDLRARIRGHYAVSRGLELHASLMPGYTIVLAGEDGVESAKGFAVGGSVGVTYDVSPKMFVGGEVGYQHAFTSADLMVGAVPIAADLDLSYLHIGLGAGTRF
jgi:hypothetical protein